MAKNFKKKDASKEDSFEFKKKKSSSSFGKSSGDRKFSSSTRTEKPKFSDKGKADFSKDKPRFAKKYSSDQKGKFSDRPDKPTFASKGTFDKEKKSSFSNFKKKGSEAASAGRGTFGSKAGKANTAGKFSGNQKSDSPRKFDREQKTPFSAKPDFKKKNSSYSDYRKKGADSKSTFGPRDKNVKPNTWAKKSPGKSSTRPDKSTFSPKGKFEIEKKFSKDAGVSDIVKPFEDKSKSFSKPKADFKKPFDSDSRKDKSSSETFIPRDKKDVKKKTKNEDEVFEINVEKKYTPSEEKKISSKKPPEKKQDPAKTEADTLRLNRYISNAGVCSRRDADVMIKEGLITVNGNVVTEMGCQVATGDVVRHGNRVLNPEKQVYILLNKPKDFITTMDDPGDRKTVMDLIKNACKERVYPVGRLDRNTTGLLLLTNDGEMADKLTHPSNEIKKIYQVEIDKPITPEDFEKIQEGLTLEDGPVKVDDVAIVSSDRYILGMEIHVGRNRIVRRIFEHLGYEVTQLDRVMYAGLSKKDLPRGKWRFLTEKELIKLRYFV